MPDGVPGVLTSSFTTEQAYALGLTKHVLLALHGQGLVERIGHGAYRRSDAEPADNDLVEIALRAPDATLCLETALAEHGLSDLIPPRHDIAIRRGRRPPAVRAPVSWHRFDPATFDIGRELKRLDPAVSVGIYNAERAIIDTVRLRHLQGPEVAYEAIRRYLQEPGAQPRPLLAMARHFPQAEPELRKIIKIALA